MEEIERIIALLNEKHEDYFVSIEGKCCFNVKDGNTLSAVLNYTGIVPSKLQPTKYTVYDAETKVNKSQIETFFGRYP